MLACSVHQLAWFPELRQWVPYTNPQYIPGMAEGQCYECTKEAKESLKATSPYLYHNLPPEES
jgi:hypothetical protein